MMAVFIQTQDQDRAQRARLQKIVPTDTRRGKAWWHSREHVGIRLWRKIPVIIYDSYLWQIFQPLQSLACPISMRLATASTTRIYPLDREKSHYSNGWPCGFPGSLPDMETLVQAGSRKRMPISAEKRFSYQFLSCLSKTTFVTSSTVVNIILIKVNALFK